MRGQSLVYWVVQVKQEIAHLRPQAGFIFPFLSFSSLSFKVGTVCYVQPLAKWALIPFQTSRCYCHTNKRWAGNSLPAAEQHPPSLPVSAQAEPPASAQANPSSQHLTFETWICEVIEDRLHLTFLMSKQNAIHRLLLKAAEPSAVISHRLFLRPAVLALLLTQTCLHSPLQARLKSKQV